MLEANKIALKDCKMFSSNFSLSTLEKLIGILTEIRCSPDQIIYDEGDIDDFCVYFIEKGSVELFINNDKNHTFVKKLNSGSFFGEMSFFTANPRELSIKSSDFTVLLKIKREDFLNTVKANERDYEIFCEIRDNIMYNK